MMPRTNKKRAKSKSKKHKGLIGNPAIKMLLLTQSFVLIAGAMLGPVYALFIEELGGDLYDAGLIFATFAFFAGVTVLLTGKILDKIKNTQMIVIIGSVIMGIGFSLYIFAHSIQVLIFVEMLLGIGEAIYAPAFDMLYTKHLDSKRMGTEWSFWEALEYFTQAIGALIGGLLVGYFGFKFLFLIMAVFCVGSAIYIYLLPRNYL